MDGRAGRDGEGGREKIERPNPFKELLRVLCSPARGAALCGIRNREQPDDVAWHDEQGGRCGADDDVGVFLPTGLGGVFLGGVLWEGGELGGFRRWKKDDAEK